LDEQFAVNNFPCARATFLQRAAAFNIGAACTAASVRLILDAPSAFKVLNTQRFIATLATPPVQYAPILPGLFSGRVQSVDGRVDAFDAADEDVGGL
jgi:hypothetical protein